MKKYSLFKNLKFSLHLLTEERFQSVYGYSFVHIVLGVLCPLLFAVFPGYVAGLMTKGADLESAVGKLVLLIAGILLLQMADTYAMRMYEQILFLFRNQQGSRLMKKVWKSRMLFARVREEARGSLKKREERSMKEMKTGWKCF